MKERSVFMTARWEHLLMLNYEVPADILQPYVPPQVVLDLWQGKAVVSMVGFWFNDTRVFGFRWPMHTHFEEINLRLYVKHWDGQSWKRGVAFVSEIVPRPMIAYIANTLYNEHYHAMPTRHRLEQSAEELAVAYEWRFRKRWNQLSVKAANHPEALAPGSEAAFVLEHYWGYNKLNDRTTIEYQVEHPAWETYPVTDYKADFDIEGLYGKAFVPYLSGPPQSVLLARGSAITVRKPRRIMIP